MKKIRQGTLHRRLEGLERERNIYEYVLDNVGKKVMKTRLMRKFGLAVYGTDTDNFMRSRLAKYIIKYPYATSQKGGHGQYIMRYKRYIRDVIWLPEHLINEHRITTIACRNPRWGHKLCYKETVPFWLLAEFGGPYSDRDFITELNKRITKTKKEIDNL
jgi:hypothetical protein